MLPISKIALSAHAQELHHQVKDFMGAHLFPNEAKLQKHQTTGDCWVPHPLVEELKVSSFTWTRERPNSQMSADAVSFEHYTNVYT